MAIDHGAFLRRNGATLSALLDNPPRHSGDRTLLHELLIFVAAERPSPLVDGRTLRALDGVFSSSKLRIRDQASWGKRLAQFRSLPPDAAVRVWKLLGALKDRHDFPHVTALYEWGIHRWEDLFVKIGMDRREARTFLSLVLDRKHLMPAGAPYERVYERIGLKTDDDGVPDKKALYPEHRDALKWQLAALAFRRCTKEVIPGGASCVQCPIRLFCQAGRVSTGEKTKDALEFMDVFAGGGGMSQGFSSAGFRERLAIEIDVHAADTLYLNHPETSENGIVTKDVRALLRDKDFIAANRGIPLIIGGPPCQPYSMARRHVRPDEIDPRRFLFRPFIRLAAALQPRLIIMENVPGLLNAASGRILKHVQREFDRAGFEAEHRCLNAAEFGVPQSRQRIFFVAANRRMWTEPKAVLSAFWAFVETQRCTKQVSVQQALSGIPRVPRGGGGMVYPKGVRGPKSDYGQERGARTRFAFNHEARAHNPRDIEIFKTLKFGETAEKLEGRKPGTIPYQVASFGDKYRKLRPWSPGPTIPAHLHRDANSFVHPFVARGITCREAARLQSFPDNYIFLGGFGPAFIQTGNAVPPLLARAVGAAALAVLQGARPVPEHGADPAQPGTPRV